MTGTTLTVGPAQAGMVRTSTLKPRTAQRVGPPSAGDGSLACKLADTARLSAPELAGRSGRNLMSAAAETVDHANRGYLIYPNECVVSGESDCCALDFWVCVGGWPYGVGHGGWRRIRVGLLGVFA